MFRDFLNKYDRMDKNGRFQTKKDLKSFDFRSFLVEISGIEPLTS